MPLGRGTRHLLLGGGSQRFRSDTLPGQVAWYNAGRGVTVNGGKASNLADQSGNGFDLAQPTGDTALFLDGVDQRIEVAHHADFNFNPDVGFTVGGWFRLESLGGGAIQEVMAKYRVSGNKREWRLFLDTSDRLAARISRDGSNTEIITHTTGGALSAGKWYFGILRHDPTDNQIKLTLGSEDGEVLSQQTEAYDFGPADNVNTDDSIITLGVRDFLATEPFNGRLDSLFIWKHATRALTNSELNELYNITTPGVEAVGRTFSEVAGLSAPIGTGMVAWWDLNETPNAAADTWQDATGNGHHGTQAGTAAFASAAGIKETAARPTFEAAVVNGHPGIRFDGFDDHLFTSETLGFDGTDYSYTELIVYKMLVDNFNGPQHLRASGDTNATQPRNRNFLTAAEKYQAQIRASGNEKNSTTNAAQAAETIAAIRIDSSTGTAIAMRKNGGAALAVDATDFNIGAMTGIDNFAIGALINDSGVSGFLGAYFMEGLFYSPALSIAQLQVVAVDYLGVKYGITTTPVS